MTLAQPTPQPARQPTSIPIIGAGLAGSAAAIYLARAHHPVTLIEQHAAPRHKVCGDFLSAEALAYLHDLGLDLAAFGAVPLTTLRLATGSHLTEVPLPFPAASLTRYALDEALLQHAAAQPVVTLLRGRRVESLDSPSAPNEPWRLRLSDGEELSASHVLLASGKHDLRGHPRPPGRHSSLVAFKLYLRLSPEQHAALGPAIELILFPHGYTGLQPVEPDALGPRANLCLLVEQRFLRSVGNTWPALLAAVLPTSPHLRTRLAHAEALLPKPLALAKIPFGLLRSHSTSPTLWPMGDQAVVIPSLTGDGMSLALHTAALATRHFQQSHSAHQYLADLRHAHRHQLVLATLASQLAVRPALQPLLGLAARLAPSCLRLLAQLTRIPSAGRLAPPAQPLLSSPGAISHVPNTPRTPPNPKPPDRL